MKEMQKLRQDVVEEIFMSITEQEAEKEIRNIHTKMLIKASEGDPAAKIYVKEQIKKELIQRGIADSAELETYTEQIFAEKWGLGLLEKYDTDEYDEIMVHGTRILLQKKGDVFEAEERFKNHEEVIAVIRRCLEFDKMNPDINEQNAIVQTKRADGSRINAVIPPVGKEPYLNIRKFKSFIPTTENLLESGTINQEMADIMSMLVRGRSNIVVIGEMGSGKTTFLKWLLGHIPDGLIVGMMETTFEIHPEELYPEKFWVQLEEQRNYSLQDLFAVILRMNVDIILVGEARSYEINELIKAMSRGHSGSIGTAHSMNAEDMLDDFAQMTIETGKNIDYSALKYRIAKAIDIVIKFRKLPDRRRVCAGIYELVTDPQTMDYKAVPIYEFEIDEENPTDRGRHIKKNNISEKLKQKLNDYGVKMSEIRKLFPDYN